MEGLPSRHGRKSDQRPSGTRCSPLAPACNPATQNCASASATLRRLRNPVTPGDDDVGHYFGHGPTCHGPHGQRDTPHPEVGDTVDCVPPDGNCLVKCFITYLCQVHEIHIGIDHLTAFARAPAPPHPQNDKVGGHRPICSSTKSKPFSLLSHGRSNMMLNRTYDPAGALRNKARRSNWL